MKLTVRLFGHTELSQIEDVEVFAGNHMDIPVQLQPDGPITLFPVDALVRQDGHIDNDVERTHWIEFRKMGEQHHERAVHRSVDMYLKQGVFCSGIAASL